MLLLLLFLFVAVTVLHLLLFGLLCDALLRNLHTPHISHVIYLYMLAYIKEIYTYTYTYTRIRIR